MVGDLFLDEGVYNTYVVDADIKSGWSLLLHCAEKAQTPRYLSSLALSRKPFLDANVLAYLRDKLPRWTIPLSRETIQSDNLHPSQ